jgi:aminoglycoside 6-adenylyltransferase
VTENAKEQTVIQRLIDWANAQSSVRALILTSTRTNPDAPVDLFSDYDVIVVVTDIHPFFDDRSWLEDVGPVLVVYRDPIKLDYDLEKFAYITQYEDGTKIDYSFFPIAWLQRVANDATLPPYLDVGYTILLDKDRLTQGLKPPTYQAYIPTPPPEATYHQIVEEFFHEATYVAKHLWRDDLLPAKYLLDYFMKLISLRRMLEWRMEIDHDWSVKPGAYGKGLKQRLREELWSALERTYVGAGLDENWEALFETIALFRKVAIEVANQLGYGYLHDLDQRVMGYLQRVQHLDRDAETFV